MPTLAKNKVLAKKFTAHATTKNQRNHGVGCIHCHMVANSQLMSLRLSGEPIAEQLRKLSVENLTPVEALSILDDLIEQSRGEG